MKFYTQHQGKKISEFEKPTYKEALEYFKSEIHSGILQYPEGTVLRDYQHYIVNETTLREVECYAMLDYLRNHKC